MAESPSRPKAPHLFGPGGLHWKWGANMAVSIAHRVSGIALATAGAILLVAWLLALSNGKESYAALLSWLTWWPGKVLLIGLSWAFFQHLCSGLRHFVLDVGAGYALGPNRTGSWIVFLAAIALTALSWGWLCWLRG